MDCGMFGLTRQQEWAIGLVIFLLLTGWAVKTWRLAHPPQTAEESATSGP